MHDGRKEVKKFKAIQIYDGVIQATYIVTAKK